jgi:hypothetical protein
MSSNSNKSNDSPDLSTPVTPPTHLSIYEMIIRKQMPTGPRYTPEAALHKPVPVSDNSELSLDNLTRKALPYPLPWYQTASPGEVPPDFSWLSNSCGGKAAIGVFGGGVM